MLKSYVLIEMVEGQEAGLVEYLTARRSIREVRRVSGPYDVVAVVEAEDEASFKDIVDRDIHTRSGVVRTTCCVCLEEMATCG